MEESSTTTSHQFCGTNYNGSAYQRRSNTSAAYWCTSFSMDWRLVTSRTFAQQSGCPTAARAYFQPPGAIINLSSQDQSSLTNDHLRFPAHQSGTLPDHVVSAPSFNTFKDGPKTHLFSLSYPLRT